jgi:hypothetical protein
VLVCLYAFYFVAKFILLKSILTASLGKAILVFKPIQEFIELGIFPFFDNIFSRFFPVIYGGSPSDPIPKAIINFSTSFINKVKAGDGEPTKKDTAAEPNNPNLTQEQNEVVNKRYNTCIKENTLKKKDGAGPFTLFTIDLKNNSSAIKCQIQKITDSIEIKNTK